MDPHHIRAPSVMVTLVEQTSSPQMVLLHSRKVSATKDGCKATLEQLHLIDRVSQALCQPGNAIHGDFLLFTQALREVTFEHHVDVEEITKSASCLEIKTCTLPYQGEDASDVVTLE